MILETIDVPVQKSRLSPPFFTLPKGSVKPKHKNPCASKKSRKSQGPKSSPRTIEAPKRPAVIHTLFSLTPKRARGVGENKKAVVPSRGINDPTQKNNVDVSDNKRHLKRDIFAIPVFFDLFGPSIIPLRVKKHTYEKQRGSAFWPLPRRKSAPNREKVNPENKGAMPYISPS
jgi:hypothetical protein